MNSTNTTNEHVTDYLDLAWVLSFGSVLLIFGIALCCMCFKTSKEEKKYIAWVKSNKRGDIQSM
jgi:membrane protein required for beta-lactamase induction